MRSVFRSMRRAICSKSAALVLFSIVWGAEALQAQSPIKSFKRPEKKLYLGFDVSFGTRLFQIQSNIDAIRGMDVLEEGGAAGLLFGNQVVQVKVRQGYFYSASRVSYTADLVQTSFEININPLQLAHPVDFRRFEPYLLAGVSRDAVKFYGYYIDAPGTVGDQGRESARKPNYSYSEMPYLGRVASTRAEGGLGMMYRINMVDSFLRIFGEVRYGYAVGHSATPQFEDTTAAHQMSFSLGTSFGWKLK